MKIKGIFTLVIFVLPFQIWANNSSHNLIKLYNEGKYQQAIAYADSCLLQNENVFDIWYYKGLSEQSLYQYSQSIVSLQHASALTTDKTSVLFLLGNAWEMSGNSQKAVETYQNLLKTDSLYIPAIVKLAKVYKSEKDYLPAIDLFSKCVRLDSTNGHFYAELAYCCNKFGFNEPVIYYYEKAIELNPDDLESCQALVNEFIDQKKYTDAGIYVDSFLVKNPDNLAFLKQRAYISAIGGNYLDAVREFQRVVDMGDSSAFTSKYYGQSLYNNGQYDEAVFWLDRYLKSNPDDSKNQFIMGMACQNAYRYKKSIEHFDITLSQLYNIQLIVKIYTETGNTLVKYGDYLGFRDSTGTLAPEKYKLAIEQYLKAEELNTDNFDIYRLLGIVYEEKIKDKKLALYYYEKYYKQLDPTKIQEYELIWVESKITKLKEDIHFMAE